MIQLRWWVGYFGLCLVPFVPAWGASLEEGNDGNRLVYLAENDPFHPDARFPRLTTSQWIGEAGVDAVVILAIDDLRDPAKYEAFLRPILERLKAIDGRAPVSIMCNAFDPAHALPGEWLREGLSLETHTLIHPCPFLARSNFVASAQTYHEGVALLNQVPGNRPVAFRMPCCDSIDSPSPRFYAEIFNRTNSAGEFLTIDSSAMNIPSAQDPVLPRAWVVDPDGREKFKKYLPFPAFTTTVENYPYPYTIGKLCWEFPPTVPSDWEAQHLNGTNSPVTLADWKVALDVTVLKQGVFTFVFHPHGWIRADQMVEFIDYARQRYGSRVKFLNFREAAERLNANLLEGQPLRDASGQDNGVRMLDLNNDGWMDVVIGNSVLRKTRLWLPSESRWRDAEFPVQIVTRSPDGRTDGSGAVFGVLDGGRPILLVNRGEREAWRFDGEHWTEARSLWAGLDLDGQPIFTSRNGRDRGVRLRDVDSDGRCELIVSNPEQNAVFAWSDEEASWSKLPYALPPGTAIVNALGQDGGLRFPDINEDGYPDVVFSDELRYSLHLFVPKLFLGFQPGWSREVISGRRGEPGEIPMIVRAGPERNNGAWFHSRGMWVQNEDTAALPDHVDRRSYDELLGGFQPKPKSPRESLACLRTRPGFKIELVASEPLVKDPIAFDWGPDGKFWVVEMGDYPSGIDGAGRPGGVVRCLEDTDGDGRYDRSTPFLEGLNFPTGVMPWRNGILVSAAPEIFYAEDRDGDGKADLRVTLFKGFNEGNQQHRLNGFEFGLDNWVYGANGDSGGRVVALGRTSASGVISDVSADHGPYELRGHDFRFKPDQGLFETVAGQTQFGRHRDDWGNWFGNNNPAWLWHFVFPEEYLARNPHLPVRSVKHYLADYPQGTRVFPVSRSLQRFNDVAMLNHVTSANSPTPYRDDLFGPEFQTSVFISEPVHNVVHREVLQPDGATFTSHRPDDERESEFLASTDNWFRPVMLKTGPDGALYIADMYRLVLEHPEWIPADTQRRLDLRAGSDLGRIYRVYPEGAHLSSIPRLAGLSALELADRIESPNGWTRDTAQRLIVCSDGQEAVNKLAALVQKSSKPKTRLQALCTLDGLGRVPVNVLKAALADPHASVRQQAVRLCEPYLAGSGRLISPSARNDLELALLGAVNDPAPIVRFQLAFTLGTWPDERAGRALASLGGQISDANLQTAVLSSAVPHVKSMLESLLQNPGNEPPNGLLRELLSLATTLNNQDAILEGIKRLSQPDSGSFARWQFVAMDGFLDGIERQSRSFATYCSQAPAELKPALEHLHPLFAKAREIACSAEASEADRLACIPLLGRERSADPADTRALADLLQPRISVPLQKAALENLRQSRDSQVPSLLLRAWKSYEPALRTAVIGVLLSRSEWMEALLESIEQGAIAPAQISAPDRQKMLGSSHTLVHERAARLFAVAPDRRRLLDEFHTAMEVNGDKSRGAALFRQNCAMCHRLKEEGFDVGPNLGAVANKSGRALLIAILDPNQAVEARYINYTATTKSDHEFSGIIVAETPASVTLRGPGGLEETILRSDLNDLVGSGLSLMPEGFEKTMNPADLADLIAFISNPD